MCSEAVYLYMPCSVSSAPHGLSMSRSTLQRSRYWPIGTPVGTRTWSVTKCSRDPAGQSEFLFPFAHVMRREEHYVGRRAMGIKIKGRRKHSCLSHSRFQTGWQSSRLQIVYWHNYKLKPFANSNRDTEAMQIIAYRGVCTLLRSLPDDTINYRTPGIL